MIDEIVLLQARARRELPDFELETGHLAVLPVYRLRVTATVLMSTPLSVTARFLLRVVALGGAMTVGEVGDLLGLSEEELASAGSELLGGGYLTQTMSHAGSGRQLDLTNEGRLLLEKERTLMVPRRMSFKLHYDPLTREVSPVDTSVYKLEEVHKQGLFAIPTVGGPPVKHREL